MPLLANALTWTVGTKRRTASRPANGAHRPSRCRDEDCPRLLCRGYKDGYEDARDEAEELIAEAYAEGFAAGVAAAGK